MSAAHRDCHCRPLRTHLGVGLAYRDCHFISGRDPSFLSREVMGTMRYVCDAPEGKIWFQIETEGEAARETDLMGHAVEKHFRQAREQATGSYVPPSGPYVEQDIGLKAHLHRVMPVFLTLRDREGNGLATAMLPPRAEPRGYRSIVVGPGNSDPYPQHESAIRKLGEQFGLTLDRARCYPYGRT